MIRQTVDTYPDMAVDNLNFQYQGEFAAHIELLVEHQVPT